MLFSPSVGQWGVLCVGFRRSKAGSYGMIHLRRICKYPQQSPSAMCCLLDVMSVIAAVWEKTTRSGGERGARVDIRIVKEVCFEGEF